MLVALEQVLSPCPVGLCLIEYAPTLSPSFLFVHFISTFSKNPPSSRTAGPKGVVFVSLHSTLGLLRMTMGKMAQRLNLDTFRFVSVSDFLSDSLLFDCDQFFSWITEVLRSLPDRPQLVLLDDPFLSHPSICPSKLLQFLLLLFARLPDRSLLVIAAPIATRLSVYAHNFFNFHIRLTPIGDGLGKNITGQMEVFRRDLQRNSLPSLTLLHYHCGQRSAKTFMPGSKQLLI